MEVTQEVNVAVDYKLTTDGRCRAAAVDSVDEKA